MTGFPPSLTGSFQQTVRLSRDTKLNHGVDGGPGIAVWDTQTGLSSGKEKTIQGIVLQYILGICIHSHSSFFQFIVLTYNMEALS